MRKCAFLGETFGDVSPVATRMVSVCPSVCLSVCTRCAFRQNGKNCAVVMKSGLHIGLGVESLPLIPEMTSPTPSDPEIDFVVDGNGVFKIRFCKNRSTNRRGFDSFRKIIAFDLFLNFGDRQSVTSYPVWLFTTSVWMYVPILVNLG